jgi:hypothetical protein
MHGGAESSGGQPGNRNALKHGRYSAESITLRRHIRHLLCSTRDLIEKV